MYDEFSSDLSSQFQDFPKNKIPRWGAALKSLIDDRKNQGHDVSVQWLAEKTGINAKHIFNIIAERVQDPSSEKLVKLAEAFGLSFPEFAQRALSEHPGSVHFTGFGQRGYIEYSQHGFSLQSLSPPGTGARDFFMGIMTIRPFKDLKKWKFSSGSMICLYVQSGTLEFTYGSKTKRIHSNESVYFDGSIPHKLRNIDSIDAKLILVTRPPLH